MTAEIAIMNKMAVALAADSKVTIGAEGQEKTFDTVNKLFTLSRVHPVGIMIYGNAEFMEFPWETIIKEYRKQKVAAEENTIEDWAKDFLVYLQNNYKFSRPEWEHNVKSLANSIFADVFSKTQRRFLDDTGQKAFEIIMHEVMDDEIARAKRCDEFLAKDQYNKFVGDFGPTIDTFISTAPVKDGSADKLRELLLLHMTRHCYSPNMSGVVIAGFGRNEKLPALYGFALDGFVGPHLKHQKNAKAAVSATNSAVVIPFAQKDMVVRFMEGIDSNYSGFLDQSFSDLIVSTTAAVLDKYHDPGIDLNAAKADVAALSVEAFKNFRDQAVNYRREKFSSPIIDMVSSLPKEELANMAEALVNLTSLKRRISRDRETVGGPVDVAVISKGDGFIWVKRKHYFDPQLNHHFAANYFRDMGEKNGSKPKRA